MLSVVMLGVVMLTVVMLSFIMLSVIMLSVIYAKYPFFNDLLNTKRVPKFIKIL